MLSQLLESWTSLYANHGALRTGVEFAHIAGLVAGGGCAIVADLATLSATGDSPADGTTRLPLFDWTHRLVAFGLVALFVSGVLLVAADLETFLYSRIFWLKMGLLVLLLINGALLWRGERQVKRGEAGAWTRLHYAAMASLLLWFLTTLAGAALPNIG